MWTRIRRARLRGLIEGLVQRVRAESLNAVAHDDVERFQDYGFAANAVEGQGLVIEAGGHTIVVRMDRLAERPNLPSYVVAVWHKEGHSIHLKAGRIIQLDCDTLNINASAAVNINTPTVSLSNDLIINGTSLRVNGVEHVAHHHGGVSTGGANTANLA